MNFMTDIYSALLQLPSPLHEIQVRLTEIIQSHDPCDKDPRIAAAIQEVREILRRVTFKVIF